MVGLLASYSYILVIQSVTGALQHVLCTAGVGLTRGAHTPGDRGHRAMGRGGEGGVEVS